MGGKQTKTEGVYSDVSGEMRVHQSKAIELAAIHVEDQQYIQKETPPRPADNLRRRFFKGFTYNLNDPRSPSILNRTPLLFDDKNDKTLDLDDTFADLLVDSRNPVQENVPQIMTSNKEIMETVDEQNTETATSSNDFNAFENLHSTPHAKNESASVEFASLIEEETMPCSAVLKQTPPIFQQSLDPRSPTIGLTRTPIVFDDDDEAQEDAMLEDILATLSLDFSGANSTNSFGSITASPLSVVVKKPINKHLDRVRAVKKPEKPIRKTKYAAQKQRIYLDSENANVTPKRKINKVGDSEKRTPLSCVKNKVHLRSRSVESNGKSPKLRLSLTSYDDSLNPIQDRKIINLHAMQGDLFDL